MSQGDPVPGCEIYIEQEPNDEPITISTTDEYGNTEFKDLTILKKGFYDLGITINEKIGKLEEYKQCKNIKIFVKIEQIQKFRKISIVNYEIELNKKFIKPGKRTKLTTVRIFEDINFNNGRQKASGNRGGFAIGGFSCA